MPHVQLSRYMGRWYEIARYPKWFEKNCYGVTADYALRPDGTLSVLNTCHEGSSRGPVRTASGRAWKTGASNARLRVRFFWPFSSPYWIIELDPDYRWAVVGHPQRKYLWILSRTPKLPQKVEAGILKRLAALGYDVSKLKLDVQSR